MLGIGEVEDAKNIDDLFTSASIPGTSILDFENLDFKIGSGLRKIPTRNFKKQITKLHPRSDHSRADKLLG